MDSRPSSLDWASIRCTFIGKGSYTPPRGPRLVFFGGAAAGAETFVEFDGIVLDSLILMA